MAVRVGFLRIPTKTYFTRSMPACQPRQAARPEIVTIAKMRPAFLASVRAMLWMNAGSVGEAAWRKRGRRSLATGPVAAPTSEKPAGGGGIPERLPDVRPWKMLSAASPIAPRVERKTARPTMNPRPTFPPAMIPPRRPAVSQGWKSGGQVSGLVKMRETATMRGFQGLRLLRRGQELQRTGWTLWLSRTLSTRFSL